MSSAQCQEPQPTPEVVVSDGASASGEVGGGGEVRQEEEEMKFEERKNSKMKSYGGRKTKGNPRREEECHQEEIQKAREALEKREETIDLEPGSPNPEETLSVGMTEKKYKGSQPRQLVSLPAPPPPLSSERRLDCSPTREEDVTIEPAMTDLRRKRENPGRKCKENPGSVNRNQHGDYFSWKGEKIGLEEILELEEFYQNLASGTEHSLETILKAEPRNSSISREKNFFFEVYLKYQMIIEMIPNASTTTLMSLLSFHHLHDEDFKKMILKEKKEEEAAPPGSPAVTPQSSSVSAGLSEPSVSLQVPPSGDDEPLDLSLPTRVNARLGLEQAEDPGRSSTLSKGPKKTKKVSTEEEEEKEDEEKLKEREKKEVKLKKVKVVVKKIKKEIKEKPKTTRKVQFANTGENSTATFDGSQKEEDKIETSVFLSMEEESQEVQELSQPVQEQPDLGLSESATTITIEDQSLWKVFESDSDLQTSPDPDDLSIDLDLFNL